MQPTALRPASPRLLADALRRPAPPPQALRAPPPPPRALPPWPFAARLPAVGGKVGSSGACALWGPGKSVQRPLTSRITVHLIGCSAGQLHLPRGSRPVPGGWGFLQVLKILVLQRPSETLSSCLVLQIQKLGPKERKKRMVHKLMAEPALNLGV